MYCASCGTPITTGLSFCNRCGVSLKERESKPGGPVSGLLAGAIFLPIVGLAMIVIGSIALKQAGSFDGDPIAVFMSCSFVLLTILEILLLRQLSRELEARRLTAPEREKTLPLPGVRRELQPSNVNSLPEPVSSVTENTTRTLGYTSRD